MSNRSGSLHPGGGLFGQATEAWQDPYRTPDPHARGDELLARSTPCPDYRPPHDPTACRSEHVCLLLLPFDPLQKPPATRSACIRDPRLTFSNPPWRGEGPAQHVAVNARSAGAGLPAPSVGGRCGPKTPTHSNRFPLARRRGATRAGMVARWMGRREDPPEPIPGSASSLLAVGSDQAAVGTPPLSVCSSSPDSIPASPNRPYRLAARPTHPVPSHQVAIEK
jgi:hypothetical protein